MISMNNNFNYKKNINDQIILRGVEYNCKFVWRKTADFAEFFVFRSGIQNEITMKDVIEFEKDMMISIHSNANCAAYGKFAFPLIKISGNKMPNALAQLSMMIICANI